MAMRRNAWGVIVLSLLALTVGVCAPKWRNAWNAVHWIGSAGNLRILAQAVEDYRKDRGRYPDADSIAKLSRAVIPEYLAHPIERDDWGREFRYEHWTDAAGIEHAALGCAGGDGRWERTRLRNYPPGEPDDYDADGVLVDGAWRQRPRHLH